MKMCNECEHCIHSNGDNYKCEITGKYVIKDGVILNGYVCDVKDDSQLKK